MTYLQPKLQQISQPKMFCFSSTLAVCFCLVLVATAASAQLAHNLDLDFNRILAQSDPNECKYQFVRR